MGNNSYFNYFPIIDYSIANNNETQKVLDLTHSARLQQTLVDNSYIYYEWQVQGSDTPEDIAFKYYGSTDYFWVVLHANQMYSRYFDWVMSHEQLQAYITQIYGSINMAQLTVHHYEDGQGNIIDLTTFNQNGGLSVDCYMYLDKINEAKRTIKLIDKAYLKQITTELLNILHPSY
jgi:hypothetical protein